MRQMRNTANKYRAASVLILLLIAVSVSGCYDQREIDDLAYPLAVGLDIGEANALRMTLQLAAPLAIGGGGGGESGGGSGSSEGNTSSVITVDTPTLYSGLDLINNIISKEINLSHAKVIIFSRRLAEAGISKYIQAIQRGREFRPNMFVMVSNEPPDEYLKNIKPILESNPSKYYELLLGKDYASFFDDVRMSDFHFAIESDFKEPAAILTGINKKENVEQLGQSGGHRNAARPEGIYEAGDIPVISDLKNVVMGIAVFKEGRMVGTLNGAEASCYQMLTGNYGHSYWTVPDAYDAGKLVVMDIIQRSRPSVTAVLNDGKAVFDIVLDLEGDFTSIQSSFRYEDYPQPMEDKASEMIKKEVTSMLKKTTEQFDSDICGFGRYLKGKFLTLDDWKKFNWPEQYRNAEFNVKVDLKVRRTGLIIKSMQQSE